MNIGDFNSRMNRAQRRHDRMFRIVSVGIGLIWLGMICAIGFGAYLLLSTSPEELGSFFGRIVAGFNSAA